MKNRWIPLRGRYSGFQLTASGMPLNSDFNLPSADHQGPGPGSPIKHFTGKHALGFPVFNPRACNIKITAVLF
jgi:hypothetical protein